MPNALYGWAGGQQQADRDSSALALDRMSMAESATKIAAAPAHLRLLNAQAGEAEFKLSREQQMVRLMQDAAMADKPPPPPPNGGQPPQPPPGQVASGLDAVVDRSMRQLDVLSRGGFPMEALKGAEHVTQIAAHQRAAAASDALIKEREFKQVEKEIDDVGSMLAQVHNLPPAERPAAWDRANAAYKFLYSKPSRYEAVPYSEEVYNLATNERLSAKDRLTLARQKERDRIADDFKRTELRDKQFRTSLYKRNVESAIEARNHRTKAVGSDKPDKLPGKEQVSQVMGLIKSQYPGFTDAEQLRTAAVDIEAAAVRLTKTNPGLNIAQARQQVLTAHADDFKTEMSGGMFGVGGHKATTFQGGGSTPETALPVGAKLKEGRYYTQGGVTKQWKGGKWKEAEKQDMPLEPVD